MANKTLVEIANNVPVDSRAGMEKGKLFVGSFVRDEDDLELFPASKWDAMTKGMTELLTGFWTLGEDGEPVRLLNRGHREYNILQHHVDHPIGPAPLSIIDEIGNQ